MNRVKTNIYDFGRKIGGARKDYYAAARAMAEKFAAAASVEALHDCKSLTALVRLPNLESLTANGAITAEAARAALVIWRSIDRKPLRSSWRVNRWAETTAPKLAIIADLLQGGNVPEAIKTTGEFEVLTVANWPAVAFSFGTWNVAKWTGTIMKTDGTEETGTFYRVRKGDGWGHSARTAADALALLNKGLESDAARRADGPALAASQNRAGLWYIHPEHNAEICIKTLSINATSADARRVMKEERAALVARLHELQQFPELRRDWNRPRTGQEWREGGKDITPEEFSEAFPFYGVEFGNWVTQTERANLLNAAFDGFYDLAQIWHISPVMCALRGSLAFAFGSRGISKASAHYEPSRRVINLTKKNGAGCMAHEWFHAVDNWMMYREGFDGYATEAGNAATTEAGRAGAALLQAIKKTEFYRRSSRLSVFKGDYWVEGRELAARAFEGVCAFLLKRAGICSDFLVNCVSMDEFTKKDTAHRSNYYPYPTEAEAAQLAPYYFALLRIAFGASVEMDAETRAAVDDLAKVAQSEHDAAQAERDKAAARIEEEKKSRRMIETENAKKESIANREKVEAVTADVIRECGATWSFVFDSWGKSYAVGGADGFIFLVYYTGNVAYRLTRVNTRLRKNFRGCFGYVLEYRNGVNLPEVIRNDVKGGFTCGSLMVDVFRHSVISTWAEFAKKHAAELAKVQSVNDDTQKEEETHTEPQNAPQGEAVSTSATATTETTTESAPVAGLILKEIAGGVAVVGDSRTTYRNRKTIKAHGARWNKDAKEWQATDPAAVASLRAWLTPSEDEQRPVTNEAQANEETPAGVSSQAENVTASEGENVEKSNYSTSEKSQNHDETETGDGVETSANSFGVYELAAFDDKQNAPRLLNSFATEDESREWINRAAAGAGSLTISAVNVLHNAGGYWMAYYSERNGGYYLLFISVKGFELWKVRELDLAGKLANLREQHTAAQALHYINGLISGKVYAIERDGNGVTVEPDTLNKGRFVVEWYEDRTRTERHTDKTTEEAAAAVAAFVVDTMTAKEWFGYCVYRHVLDDAALPYYMGCEELPIFDEADENDRRAFATLSPEEQETAKILTRANLRSWWDYGKIAAYLWVYSVAVCCSYKMLEESVNSLILHYGGVWFSPDGSNLVCNTQPLLSYGLRYEFSEYSRDGVFIQQYSTKSKDDAIKYVAVFAYQHSEELEPIGNQIAAAL